MTAPEPAVGTPGPATLMRLAVLAIDAGVRRDTAAMDAVIGELRLPFYVDENDVLLYATNVSKLAGAMAAVCGDLLRGPAPAEAFARQAAAYRQAG